MNSHCRQGRRSDTRTHARLRRKTGEERRRKSASIPYRHDSARAQVTCQGRTFCDPKPLREKYDRTPAPAVKHTTKLSLLTPIKQSYLKETSISQHTHTYIYILTMSQHGWIEAVDPRSGKTYFANTGKMSNVEEDYYVCQKWELDFAVTHDFLAQQ